nr:P2-B polypeptide [Rhinovirus A]
GLSDYVEHLGQVFGVGFVDSIKQQVNFINPTSKIGSKVIKWLLRIVSAMIIMVRNSSDPQTVIATLTLLGCSGSPWRFLKEKLCAWLQLSYVHKQ